MHHPSPGKVRVKVLDEVHDQAVLVSSIKCASTINVLVEDLGQYDPNVTTSDELDSVFIAVVSREGKYVPINGLKFLSRLISQGKGVAGDPLRVKLVSNIRFKSSRISKSRAA